MRKGLIRRIGTAGLYALALLRVVVIGAMTVNLYPSAIAEARDYHAQILLWARPDVFIQTGAVVMFYLLLVWLAHARLVLLDALAVLVSLLVLHDGVIDYARGLAEVVEAGLQG